MKLAIDPIEVRFSKCPNRILQYRVIIVWGLATTTTTYTVDWKLFLRERGWWNVPRVWD
jgi:hypothetical protein